MLSQLKLGRLWEPRTKPSSVLSSPLPGCEISCDREKPAYIQVRVGGALTRGSVGFKPLDLVAIVTESLKEGRPIIVDLKEVSRIDEDGIAALISCVRLARDSRTSNGKIGVVISASLQEQHEYRRLGGPLRFSNSVGEALSMFECEVSP